MGGARGGQLMGFLQITPFWKIGENHRHRVESGQKFDYLRDLNNPHLIPKERSWTCSTHLSESSTRLREPLSGDPPQFHKISKAMTDFSTAHNHCLMQRL